MPFHVQTANHGEAMEHKARNMVYRVGNVAVSEHNHRHCHDSISKYEEILHKLHVCGVIHQEIHYHQSSIVAEISQIEILRNTGVIDNS